VVDSSAQNWVFIFIYYVLCKNGAAITFMKSLSDGELEELTRSERSVYKVLAKGFAKSEDVDKIAKFCKLTEPQVKVAIQLLKHKQILPTEKLIK
jgi:hypothetical protein